MHGAVICTAAVVAVCLAFVTAAAAAAVQDHACGTRHPTAQEVCAGRIALRMGSVQLVCSVVCRWQHYRQRCGSCPLGLHATALLCTTQLAC